MARTKASQQQPSLFQEARQRFQPLAERLRPRTLDDVIGQPHLTDDDGPLRRMVVNRHLVSLLLWGPPGVGKTTLARVLATSVEAEFVALSAVNSGVKDLREVVEAAQTRQQAEGRGTVLFLDEIHRYSKTQQDALLPHVEDGTLTLIGATTENPCFQVVPALLSRMLLLRLEGLDRAAMLHLLKRAVEVTGVLLEPKKPCANYLLRHANGDGRKLISLLDAALACAPATPPDGDDGGPPIVTLELLERLAQQTAVRYDGGSGDQHYDHASAYQKSLRGSDANAAIYWLAKMIAAGEDLRFITRRLVVTAAEDVGLADPQALVIAQSAADACERLGLPEARIPLALATLYVAQAPKSNVAIKAIDAALHDIQQKGWSFDPPPHLRDAHYPGAKQLGHGQGYIYTHDHPTTPQQFLPDALVGRVNYVTPP